MLHEKKKRRQKQKQRVLQCPVTFSNSVVDDDDEDDVWRQPRDRRNTSHF